MTIQNYDLWLRGVLTAAQVAGGLAAHKCHPTPMIVVEPSTGRRYDVAGGACGFAYVYIETKKSRKLLNALKRIGIGYRSDYQKCWVMSPEGDAGYTQSLQIKEAYVRAYARVLTANGIDCSVYSRLD